MPPPPADREPRYHRRILALGATATFALLVIGGPIYSNRIESDLERRVPVELAAAGFDGVTASFSGQDGILTCVQPLDDPEAALGAAYDVWGVRAVDLERSCRVNRAPVVQTTTTVASVETTTDQADADVDSTPVPTTDPPADFATVGEILSTSAELTLLSVLLQEADLAAGFADPGSEPVSLFAPTDGAFDMLAADTVAQLRSDPALLRRVLEHHMVPGSLRIGDLSSGQIVTVDGGSLELGELANPGPDEVPIIVDGANVVTPDLVAANGVVHIVNRVLVPADVDLTPPDVPAEVAVVFADGGMELRGVVATEVERAALVSASAESVPAVVDELTVDPDVGLDAVTTASLVEVVRGMAAHLIAGVAGFDGEGLYVRGTYLTVDDREALLVAIEPLDVVVELVERPTASETDAARLEAELNEFVADNPIRFEPTSATLTPEADAILDRIATDVMAFGGLTITVEGHTDSDGDPLQNLALSTRRAEAVRAALVERGVDPGAVAAQGFGSDRPVLVDGVEDKAASRRVEFRLVAA